MLHLIMLSLIPSFLWGLQPIIDTVAMGHIHLMIYILVTSLFYTIISIAYFCIYPKSFHNEFPKLDKKLVGILLAAASVAFVAEVVYLQLLKTYNFSTAIVTALTYTSPLFTTLLAFLILKHKISMTCILGIVMIVLGAGVVATCHIV